MMRAGVARPLVHVEERDRAVGAAEREAERVELRLGRRDEDRLVGVEAGERERADALDVLVDRVVEERVVKERRRFSVPYRLSVPVPARYRRSSAPRARHPDPRGWWTKAACGQAATRALCGSSSSGVDSVARTGRRLGRPQPQPPVARHDLEHLAGGDRHRLQAQHPQPDDEQGVAARGGTNLLDDPDSSTMAVDAKAVTVPEPVLALEGARDGRRRGGGLDGGGRRSRERAHVRAGRPGAPWPAASCRWKVMRKAHDSGVPRPPAHRNIADRSRACTLRSMAPDDPAFVRGPDRDLGDGVLMPVLGLGVWQMAEGRETEQAVEWALEAGYRHIDTAQMYRNERSVGAAVARSGLPREDVFVTTKWVPMARGATSELKRSLERLGFDTSTST